MTLEAARVSPQNAGVVPVDPPPDPPAVVVAVPPRLTIR